LRGSNLVPARQFVLDGYTHAREIPCLPAFCLASRPGRRTALAPVIRDGRLGVCAFAVHGAGRCPGR